MAEALEVTKITKICKQFPSRASGNAKKHKDLIVGQASLPVIDDNVASVRLRRLCHFFDSPLRITKVNKVSLLLT